MRKLLWLACLLPLIAQAEGGGEQPKTYRWTDKAGVVHFSSSPPPAGVKAEEIELRQPNAVIHMGPNRERLLQQGKSVDKVLEAQEDERNQLLQQIEATRLELEQAQSEYTKGETPHPNERQRLASGGSRLSPAYQERRNAETKKIEELQRQLADLYQQLNSLR